ncbi:hypothetical protein [Helicobacter fennelliae]|uniref:Uncharacterized protein n=1 Tax=Helicobacter fennelliae MRY12-0050 TaxID=1325130 RepID=T1DUS6_9HELI|nr:hypothetical protein [Helicobacter fennelliae]GAD18158.1 hypothetical protein HFN_1756 [Helicobacter fennelliae MRY12-0050]
MGFDFVKSFKILESNPRESKSSLFCYATLGLCLRSHISGSLKFLACDELLCYTFLYFCLPKISTQPQIYLKIEDFLMYHCVCIESRFYANKKSV